MSKTGVRGSVAKLPDPLIIFNTSLQADVYDIIKKKPGDDPAFLAFCVDTTPQGFGRVAHTLMRRRLVYYYDGGDHREWYPTAS